MPEFINPFKNNNIGRKLTKEEVINCIRVAIAAELEAVNVYEQIANNTDYFAVQKVMRDIAKEEQIHTSELLRLLYMLNPNERKEHAKGFKEVEELLKNPEKL